MKKRARTPWQNALICRRRMAESVTEAQVAANRKLMRFWIAKQRKDSLKEEAWCAAAVAQFPPGSFYDENEFGGAA